MKSFKKIVTTLTILFAIVMFNPMVTANTINNHEITLETIEDTYSIEEHITIQQDNGTIQFMVHPEATDITAIINNTQMTTTVVEENIYQINYSKGINNTITNLIITYSYPKQDSSEPFTKDIIYETSELSIHLDQKILSTYEDLNQGLTLSVHLYEDQDAKRSLNLYTTILIALLVVLVIVTSVYGFKKRRHVSERKRDAESSELLSTEKALLMNILKEIEKKHRDKKISDETYQKLKTYYKQQTVDIMSSLEQE